jgi:hypothetical protein
VGSESRRQIFGFAEDPSALSVNPSEFLDDKDINGFHFLENHENRQKMPILRVPKMSRHFCA